MKQRTSWNARPGLQGDGRRRIFTKLLKDKSASMRDRLDAVRFLDGMETFQDKLELMAKLNDNREQGSTRIRECLAFIASIGDVEALFIRLLRALMTDETCRPMYVRLRNRILIEIFVVPMLMETLVELQAATVLPTPSLGYLCGFLVAVSSCFIEARRNDFVMEMARQLKNLGHREAQTLSSLVLVNTEPKACQRTEATKESIGVAWVTDLIEPGGRHDNDHLNFRNVRIVPTAAELASEKRPWLPLSSGENNFESDPVTCLIGNNFRLLREDAIFTMKEKIQEKYRPWSNARITDVDASVRDGMISFVVQCDSKSKNINWDISRSLSHGTVVAFCANDTPLFMGSITIRNADLDWLNAKGGPKFGVRFDLIGGDFRKALTAFIDNSVCSVATKRARTSDGGSAQAFDLGHTFDLIEVSSSFVTYRPILKSLQEMTSLPFVDEICHLRTPITAGPLNYLPLELKMPDDKICAGHKLNLQSTTIIKDILSGTTLDESQARALHHSLTSRLTLIQGPPGTGKTFIGALISRVIRENTDESILCLCYTNHALDQFLEHMLDAGETRIVRIGSRSKSERLADYQLRALARKKAERTRQNCRRYSQVTAQMHQLKDHITASMEVLKDPIQWTSPNGGFAQYLADEYPVYFHSLCVPKLDDGFQIVGRHSKALSSDYLWKCWYGGDEFPDFLAGYLNETSEFEDFWSIPPDARIKMANRWKEDLIQEDVRVFMEQVEEFQSLCEERQSIRRDQDLQILRDARVIGATTTGAAQYKELLESKQPGILIVEEAGEVLESHVLAALQSESTKHLIMIGDHKQLRPKVESYDLTTVADRGYNFDRSLFERLVLANLPSATLAVQHRMRPEISEFVRMQTYPTLIDDETVTKFERVRGVRESVVFIDHRVEEDFANNNDEGDSSKTKSNQHEAGLCVAIAKYFLLQGYAPGSIVILTPYVGQLKYIVRRVKSDLKEVSAFLSEKDCKDLDDLEASESELVQGEFDLKSLRCSSIDNFQGEESDIVIISLVRSNRKGQIGFLREAQRVNVLMSRARFGMFMVGNSECLRASVKRKQVWDPLLDLFERNGRLLKGLPTICQSHIKDDPIILSSVEEFRLHRPNGGCTRPCGFRMECGHACQLMCHSYDKDHKILTLSCSEPCKRIPPQCMKGHACTKLCKDKCGRCKVDVGPFQLLECNHWMESVYCHEIRDEAAILALSQQCKQRVTHTFSQCGHEAITACSNAKSKIPICPARCNATVDPCGHLCAIKCGDCKDGHKCDETCMRQLFCGHICGQKCHTGNCEPCTSCCSVSCIHSKCPKGCKEVCASCIEPCDWQCEHEGKCELVCGAPCSRLPCSKRCTNILPCGHRCPSLCGEKCPSADYCHECCTVDKKSAVIDFIEMAEYEKHDVDEDPVVVLPCGHFFCTSTLDYHFGMSEVYVRAGIDPHHYSALKPLSEADISEKPRSCPQCRKVVHSINRYGRIFRLSELRSLERKHAMDLDRSLARCRLRVHNNREKNHSLLVGELDKLKMRIKKGPMMRVYEACPPEMRDFCEVPKPPLTHLIRCIELLGRVHSNAAKKKDDELYTKAKNAFMEAIEMADSSLNLQSGASVRLHLVATLMKFNDLTDLEKKEALEHLDWIIGQEQKLGDLASKAIEIKRALVQSDEISQVLKAIANAETGGYNFGTSWSSHWYQCPNGHPYYIGECGGAMQTSICPECREVVGGTGHRLNSSNRPVQGLFAQTLQRIHHT